MSKQSTSKKIVSKAKRLLPDELEIEYPPKIRTRYKIRDRLDDMPPGVRAMERRR